MWYITCQPRWSGSFSGGAICGGSPQQFRRASISGRAGHASGTAGRALSPKAFRVLRLPMSIASVLLLLLLLLVYDFDS